MKLQSEQRTDVGGRENNEDAVWSDDEQGLLLLRMEWVDTMLEK